MAKQYRNRRRTVVDSSPRLSFTRNKKAPIPLYPLLPFILHDIADGQEWIKEVREKMGAAHGFRELRMHNDAWTVSRIRCRDTLSCAII